MGRRGGGFLGGTDSVGSSRFMFAEYRELFQDKIRKTDLALALEFRCHAQLETSLQFGMTDRGGGTMLAIST